MSLHQLPFRPRALPGGRSHLRPLDRDRRVQVLLAVMAIDQVRASADEKAPLRLLCQLADTAFASVVTDGATVRLTLFGIEGAEGTGANAALVAWQIAARDRLAVR